MTDKFKKIDREFLLSDSSLNSYSYRLLTSGYLFDEFKKNPIGYYMHGTSSEFPREAGVLVKWEDLRLSGDKVYGKPCINLNHSRGQRTVDEIESGHLNAASFGHLVALEVSSDPADYLPGQTGPSISKWFNRECSLVDIPGNYNALTDLVDGNEQPLNLSDFNSKKITMEKIILTPAQLAAIPNLKADATQTEFDAAIVDLVAKATKVDGLTTDLAAANTAKADAEKKLADLQTATATAEITAMIDTATTEKRITVEAGTALAAQFAGKPVELKALLATFPKYEGLVKNLDTAGKGVADLVAKDYDTLDKEGKLEALKAAAPANFFEKYAEKFGKKHGEDPGK